MKRVSPLVEKARIAKAMRGCVQHGFPIQQPQECVRQAVSRFGDSLCVACSFGACSVAVLHMTLQVSPNILVVFNNTGVEYPETIAYKNKLKEDWKLNLLETKPIKSFWECVKKYGFPLYRGKSSGEHNPGKPQCCKYLKEIPFRDAARQHGIKAEITGLRAAESRARMFAFGQFGQNYETHKYGALWKFNPIAFWTSEQLQDYLTSHDIPANPIYEKVPRSGCMPCTGFMYWERQLAVTNPRMYRFIQRKRGVSLMDDYLTLEEERVVGSCASVDPTELARWF